MERQFRCETCGTKWFTLHDEEPGDCQRCGGVLRPLAPEPVAGWPAADEGSLAA